MDIFVQTDKVFETFKKPRNRYQGIDTASLFSLAGRYENHSPPDSAEILEQSMGGWEASMNRVVAPARQASKAGESIPGLLKSLKIPSQYTAACYTGRHIVDPLT
jgi:hypothetical protein